MSSLKITQFGSKILRSPAKQLERSEILTSETQSLIKDMKDVLVSRKLGIGLAATQVGKGLSIAVIEIQKTPLRDNVEEYSMVIINPKITKVYGRKSQMWEGCISSGAGKAGLFAKVPRYKKIELEYLDDKAEPYKTIFSGLSAHVIQHEVDHLNGILFVDKVKDTSTYMTYSEYEKMKNK